MLNYFYFKMEIIHIYIQLICLSFLVAVLNLKIGHIPVLDFQRYLFLHIPLKIAVYSAFLPLWVFGICTELVHFADKLKFFAMLFYNRMEFIVPYSTIRCMTTPRIFDTQYIFRSKASIDRFRLFSLIENFLQTRIEHENGREKKIQHYNYYTVRMQASNNSFKIPNYPSNSTSILSCKCRVKMVTDYFLKRVYQL